MEKKILEIVEVWWVDAETEEGWSEIDEEESHKPLKPIPAIGFLVHESLDAIVLALSCDYCGTSNPKLTIPRVCIVSQKTLKKIEMKS